MKARAFGHTIEVPADRVRGTGPASAPRLHSGRLAASPYRSTWEAAYAQQLELDKTAGRILDFWYEPFSFRLAHGKRYKPDFVVWHPFVAGSGSIGNRWTECIEVKGHHKNIRDSLTHLIWASQRFPFFKWLLVWREHGEWTARHISG